MVHSRVTVTADCVKCHCTLTTASDTLLVVSHCTTATHKSLVQGQFTQMTKDKP
ncbi:hypothetical protein EXN66_Car002655 [Channa argus]|uniref:Uncharacterized protein n=1 Tax=Channa argus TaxID=215402 RepID=A0A6G1P9V7_CHAAH|nr:hypothetical protein EXN66_Car002655 [Channa argus]